MTKLFLLQTLKHYADQFSIRSRFTSRNMPRKHGLPTGEEKIGGVTADNLKISKSGKTSFGKSTPTGRLLSSRYRIIRDLSVTDFSDGG